MPTLQQALANAGLAKQSQADDEHDLRMWRAAVKSADIRLRYNAKLKRDTEAYFASASANNRARNAPRVMAIRPQLDPTDARIADAAGSDAGKAYRIGGEAQPRGMVYNRQQKRVTDIAPPSKNHCANPHKDGECCAPLSCRKLGADKFQL